MSRATTPNASMAPPGEPGVSGHSAMPPTVLCQVEAGVATIKLNRPHRKNALLPDMIELLVSVLRQVAADPEVGVVLIEGAGDAFCAGGDIKAMAASSGGGPAGESNPMRDQQAFTEYLLDTTMGVSRTIREMPKIVVASLRGAVAGAGLGLALSCDLRIASNTARFTTGYSKVALTGDWGATYFLAEAAGGAVARELLLLGDVFDAAHALRLNLVNKVVDDPDLETETSALLSRLTACSPLAMHLVKQNVEVALRRDLGESLAFEAKNHAAATFSADHREALRAMRDSRRPAFRGL